MSKQSRGEKGEQKVIEVLLKMDGYFKLINNLTLQREDGNTHQIDHIFINSSGVFVIESKSLYGQIVADENDTVWMKFENKKKVVIHNPILQNKSHVRIIKYYLGNEINIIPIVVFTLNNAPKVAKGNVANIDDLPSFIRSTKSSYQLSNHQIDMIEQYLLKKESDASMEDHLDNIQRIKEKRKIAQKDITFALENRKCPHCGSKIIENKNNFFRCIKCDFNFRI